MDRSELLKLLYSVKSGEVTPEWVTEKLKTAPFEDLGFAKVDHHRALRKGVGEVIFGQSKTHEQILGIVKAMVKSGASDIIVTKLSAEAAEVISKEFELIYHPLPLFGIVNPDSSKQKYGSVVVVSGGTSDMPVAEEAALTAETLGSKVTRVYDAGVAGLHRLLAHLDEFSSARAIVAVAGMEGALASVVGGLAECPVIAVPTSVGYGASFGGISALLSMLNSCANGVGVVNIDNGFGAGYLAHIINKTGEVV
ncbi:MAG: AIR carboxylase [Firmicutes bacterium ADurb.Bin193]|nr:MAG: AIR carboxylase [Firmicutes bacterium ADurb.Bin193]